MSKRRRKSAPVKAAPGASKPRRRISPGVLAVCAVLLIATFALYAPVRSYAFVNYDDPEYVTSNLHLFNGVTPQAITWAFTSAEAANWFPLTRLSELIDYQLFGPDAGAQHVMNVSIHALSALVCFAFLYRLTRAVWPSAFVAFVFAAHPLHVESVAWISERKDVLSALFWFLTLWAYVIYTERPNWRPYLLTAGLFACGLMSKPMMVTLPLVLLLLDFWPLRRLQPISNAIREKAPFFVMSLASAAITYAVQQGSGAVKAFTAFPLGLRFENAVDSYAVYLAKTFWPTGLAVFYPFAVSIPAWKPLAAAAAIGGISYLVWKLRRNRPYLLVGWLWFVLTLVPVVGLIQVGGQSHADRYTYIPMIGIAIMIGWGGADLSRRRSSLRHPIAIAGVLASCAAVAAASVQIRYWQNTGTLFEHALAVTHDNAVAEHNLGIYLLDQPGGFLSGVSHLQSAIRINPDSVEGHTDLGSAYSHMPGHLEDAIAEYRAALRLKADSPITHNDFGNTLTKIPGRLPEAIREYEIALRLDPNFAEAHNNLGSAYSRENRFAEAIPEYEAALRLKPNYVRAHNNLGSALLQVNGRLEDAIAQYQTALQLDPNNVEARENLALAMSRKAGQEQGAARGSSAPDEQIEQYQVALQKDPGSAERHYNLGVALSRQKGREAEAVKEFGAALRINPDYAEAHNNLGVAYAGMPGHERDALQHFQAAARLRPDYVDAQYNYAMALSQIPGRLPEAIQRLQSALRLRPDPEMQRVLERLRAAEKQSRGS